MTPWLLVSGDFTPLGGMDSANYALARRLATRAEVHLVTHRAWPDLSALPSVTVHRVSRPFNRHALGAVLLARAGRHEWRRLQRRGARSVVNGGNCAVAGANWVHYLHAAYQPRTFGSPARRAVGALTRRRDLADERDALREARVVICNSRRTRADVIERIGIAESAVHVVYYGSDQRRLGPVQPAERTAARVALSAAAARPLVGFIGALGDRRKAFDTVFGAWTELCRRPGWDVDLIVIGAGAELPMWRRRAEDAGLAARIRFTGFRDDVPELIAAFDALVHPARYEAYGLSVREALCRGVPALVSASAGVAEHYPTDLADLLIANPDDVAEMIERLGLWRSNMERNRALVAPLSDVLRARTWDTMADEVAAIVEQAA